MNFNPSPTGNTNSTSTNGLNGEDNKNEGNLNQSRNLDVIGETTVTPSFEKITEDQQLEHHTHAALSKSKLSLAFQKQPKDSALTPERGTESKQVKPNLIVGYDDYQINNQEFNNHLNFRTESQNSSSKPQPIMPQFYRNNSNHSVLIHNDRLSLSGPVSNTPGLTVITSMNEPFTEINDQSVHSKEVGSHVVNINNESDSLLKESLKHTLDNHTHDQDYSYSYSKGMSFASAREEAVPSHAVDIPTNNNNFNNENEEFYGSEDDDLEDEDDPLNKLNKKAEEDEADYKPGGYHPAYIGETYKDGTYVLVRKLGWGHFSTVWLAKNTKNNTHVALKIVRSAEGYSETAIDEIELLKKVNESDKNHPGNKYIIQLLDYFKHKGPNGNHICIVFEVLGETLLGLIRRYKHKGLPIKFVKQIAKEILLATDYLHRKCDIIHTDIKPENILVGIKNVEDLLIYLEEIQKEKKFLKRISSKALIEGNGSIDTHSFSENSYLSFYGNTRYGKSRNISKSSPTIVGSQPLPSPLRTPSFSSPLTASFKASKSGNNLFDVASSNKTEIPPPRFAESPLQNNHFSNNLTLSSRNSLSSILPTGDLSSSKRVSYVYLKSILKKTTETEREFYDYNPPSADELVDDDILEVKIADLGNACWTFMHFTHDIQTRQYRSPEVILGAEYGCSADLWSIGCLIFELLTGDFLFEPTESESFSKNDDHLAQIIELLGDLPAELIQNSKYGRKYFHSDCKTLRKIPNLKPWALENVLSEKYKFDKCESVEISNFLKGMLTLDPKRRDDSAGLSNHPWLNDCNVKGKIAGFDANSKGIRTIGEGWYKQTRNTKQPL